MKTKTLSFPNIWMEVLLALTIICISLVIGYLARDFITDIQTNLLFGDGRDWGFF